MKIPNYEIEYILFDETITINGDFSISTLRQFHRENKTYNNIRYSIINMFEKEQNYITKDLRL